MENKTILIVDDEQDLAEALEEKLSNEGYTTFRGHDGKEGLALALEHKPDLILLDVMMPVMDGWEMLEELRKDAWGVHAQVTMLTNSSDLESISKAVEKGSYEYIVKAELNMQEIVEHVEQKVG